MEGMGEHLAELRSRILQCILGVIALFIACITLSDKLINWILAIGRKTGYRFCILSPQEMLLESFKISGIIAIILGLPIIVYHIARFTAPAFEGKYILFKMLILELICVALMGCGMYFSIEIILPFCLSYLISYTMGFGVASTVSVSNYLSFIVTLTVILGIVAELPLISVCLSRMGLINDKILRKIRPVAIVAIFIIAALITPPDVMSQIIVAIPIVILYEISILCSWIFRRKED